MSLGVARWQRKRKEKTTMSRNAVSMGIAYLSKTLTTGYHTCIGRKTVELYNVCQVYLCVKWFSFTNQFCRSNQNGSIYWYSNVTMRGCRVRDSTLQIYLWQLQKSRCGIGKTKGRKRAPHCKQTKSVKDDSEMQTNQRRTRLSNNNNKEIIPWRRGRSTNHSNKERSSPPKSRREICLNEHV